MTPYLTEEVAVTVSDILIRLSAETSYDDLKKAILRRLRPSKAGRVTKLLPQQPAVSQSSVPLHAQLLFRPAAVPKKNKPIFHNDQIPANTSTGEVEFMCAQKFEEFPESTFFHLLNLEQLSTCA